MTKIKYSVVLPTLNGEKNLRVTLPYMLQIKREDIEFVVSNNKSDDNTKKFILSLNDDRIKLVEPPKRLPAGGNLEYAYHNACGEWQGHIGDDDVFFLSRFNYLDKIITHTNPDVVRTEYLGYFWHNHPSNLANTLDGRKGYDGKLKIYNGKTISQKMFNDRSVHCGGAWIVKRRIIDKIREKCGFFSSNDHVEFFAMRAACALSKTVSFINLPLFVMGRSPKSSGTLALDKKRKNSTSHWDWNFESPNPWSYCPFQYKGSFSISLDAALKVKNFFPEIFSDVNIQWIKWIDAVRWQIETLIENDQLPNDSIDIIQKGIKAVPFYARLYWYLVWFLKYSNRFKNFNKIYSLEKLLSEIFFYNNKNNKSSSTNFCWINHLRGEEVGFYSILDVPKWVENNFSEYYELETHVYESRVIEHQTV